MARQKNITTLVNEKYNELIKESTPRMSQTTTCSFRKSDGKSVASLNTLFNNLNAKEAINILSTNLIFCAEKCNTEISSIKIHSNAHNVYMIYERIETISEMEKRIMHKAKTLVQNQRHAENDVIRKEKIRLNKIEQLEQELKKLKAK